jgi:two-component system, chemotaxis family, CheB/CheR fusion protein
VLSANEELQSTNEELDTAKEELQSTNEEINTVNEELHGRNEELSQVNSDLINLLSSVQIAIVIVTRDLRIRRFTPMAERVLNLIPSDVGRPIRHIKPNIDCPNLEELIARVMDTVTPSEQDVHDAHGNTFSLRIRPYKNLEDRIDGAVLALFERHGEAADEESRHGSAVALSQMVPTPIVLLGPDTRVVHVNRAFTAMFQLSATEACRRSLFELEGGGWNIPAVRTLLDAAAASPTSVESVDIVHEFPLVGRLAVRATARRVGAAGGLLALTLEPQAKTDPG